MLNSIACDEITSVNGKWSTLIQIPIAGIISQLRRDIIYPDKFQPVITIIIDMMVRFEKRMRMINNIIENFEK
jgi:hypothetical protein